MAIVRRLLPVLLLVLLTGCGSEAEVTADSSNAIDNKHVRLSYPASWTMNTGAEDYDPDTKFMVSASPKSSVQFLVVAMPDSEETVVQMIAAGYKGAVEDSQEEPFHQYGKYKGFGSKVTFSDGHDGQYVTEVFAISQNKRTYAVIVQYIDKEYNEFADGLKKIRDSFTIK